MTTSPLNRELPGLEPLLNIGEKPLCIRPVDDAMIEAQCEIRHLADGNVVFSVGRGKDFGPLLDLPDSQDRYLRLVNDRRAEQPPKHSGISNGEGPAGNFVRL